MLDICNIANVIPATKLQY